MPTANPNVAPLSRKFAGIGVTVPGVFAEGDALTADQAKWANSAIATQTGNAFGSAVRKAKEKATEDAKKAFIAGGGKAKDFDPSTVTVSLGQSDFDRIFSNFTLGAGRQAGTPRDSGDPVTRMVNFLAAEELKSRIIAKGLKVRNVMTAKAADGETSKFAELLAALIAQKGDEFRAQAEATIAAQAGADSATDDLLADLAA